MAWILLKDVEQSLCFRESTKYFHFSVPSKELWNKFYDTETIDTFVNTSREVKENDSVLVDHVCFQNYKSSVIQISSSINTKVLISTSSFYKCSTLNDNACIQISETGSCVQYKVSNYESTTHSNIKSINVRNFKNFVIQSTFTQSAGWMSVLQHKNGEILLSSINISNSNYELNAAFSIFEPFINSMTNYSNFNNISSQRQCCFWYDYGNHYFNSNNVINNSVLRDPGIFCCISSDLTVNNSFFKGNIATILFLKAHNSKVGTVDKSFFESDNTFTLNGNIINIVEMEKINLSNLYYSFLCELPTKAMKISPTEFLSITRYFYRRH